jgi:hypothetical protein
MTTVLFFPCHLPVVNIVHASYHRDNPYAAPRIHTIASLKSRHLPKPLYSTGCKSANSPIILEQPLAVSEVQRAQPLLLPSGFAGDDHVSPTQVLDEAAVENEDDDYWDVESDEGMLDEEDENNEDAFLESKELSILRRVHFEHSNELAIRRYDVFLYDGLLTHYKPEYAASPLRNLKTARVFAHYIHVVSFISSARETSEPIDNYSKVEFSTTRQEVGIIWWIM